MPNAQSLLLAAGFDEAFCAQVEVMIGAGWRVDRAADAKAACDFVRQLRPAALLVDGHGDGDAFVSAIRSLPSPFNGTPIIWLGKTDGGPAGAGGHLDRPLAQTPLRALLRHWAGPLGNHAMRAEPWNFRYRLVRLIGLDAADGMLLRLREALQQATDPVADDEPVSAHRMAGICGMCGFPDLGQQWNAADRGEDGALAAALAASRAAITEIDRALADPA